MREALLTPLAPLPPRIWRRRQTSMPFPLDRPDCLLVERARQGLWAGVRALGLGMGDEVLVPAYHHGSEVEAFERAGLVCRFYGGTPRLAPDEDELDRLVTPRTRALHLIHYLGFPNDGGCWARWCRKRGLVLIEDAAQSWLATDGGVPVGSHGGLAVFCLYKTFGLPDGAAVVVRDAEALDEPRRAIGALALEHALWLATRLPSLAWLADRRPPRRYMPEQEMALSPPRTASRATRLALPRVVDPAASAARRSNYRRLLDLLGDLVALPFDVLPEGASPFVFPIAVDEKPRVLDALRARRVRALNLWAAPHPSLPSGFAHAGELRRTLVGLPVHQELRPRDVERVAAAVRAVHAHRP